MIRISKLSKLFADFSEKHTTQSFCFFVVCIVMFFVVVCIIMFGQLASYSSTLDIGALLGLLYYLFIWLIIHDYPIISKINIVSDI